MGNTILLADKSITIQKIVELTFSDEQYTIKCVNDGQSALDAIPQVRPDIILADISLPVKNGYEVCQAIRNDPAYSEHSRTPVILLAGIYETMDEERARAVEEKVREVGANDLLSKPFDPQLLTTKVKDLLANPAAIPQPESTQAASEDPLKTQFIFAEPLKTEEPAPASEFDFSAPPDDTEKTIMLPGPPVFSNTMFADAPPFEPEQTDIDVQHTVKIESVTPLAEPVFEASQLESLPEEVPEFSPTETAELPVPDSSMFAGRQEEEFSMEGTEEETFITRPQPAIESSFLESETPAAPVFEMEQAPAEEPLFEMEQAPAEEPAFTLEQAPAAEPVFTMEQAPIAEPILDLEQPAEENLFTVEDEAKTAPQPAVIVPSAEEPFGDVFDNDSTPIENQWSASEEDSPFGLPEPAPQPQIAETEPEIAATSAEPSVVEATGPVLEAPITDVWGEPAPAEAVPERMDEQDREELEEIIGESELKPDFGEDTWSRARALSGEQTVEELFEAEEPSELESERLEEEVELKADYHEASTPIVEAAAAEIESVVPEVSNAPAEITEEMIDRIVERVISKLSERVVSDIVWQVVPDLAEKMIRRELEKLHAGEE